MDVWYRVLMTPWRYSYIRETVDKRDLGKCIFCELASVDDSKAEESFLLYRDRHVLAVLNIYPYNTGHVMVAPCRHVASLEDLSDDESAKLMKVIKASIRALRAVYKPDGFNVGVNIGKVAGAGVEDHVHVHVVPRWLGDTSFITIIGASKTVPQALDETYKLLKPALEKALKENASTQDL